MYSTCYCTETVPNFLSFRWIQNLAVDHQYWYATWSTLSHRFHTISLLYNATAWPDINFIFKSSVRYYLSSCFVYNFNPLTLSLCRPPFLLSLKVHPTQKPYSLHINIFISFTSFINILHFICHILFSHMCSFHSKTLSSYLNLSNFTFIHNSWVWLPITLFIYACL